MLTNDSSKHSLAQVHKPTQQNARVSRPLTDAQVQVPHKTALGTKEHWHREMQWRACIKIADPRREHKRIFFLLTPKITFKVLLRRNFDVMFIIYISSLTKTVT